MPIMPARGPSRTAVITAAAAVVADHTEGGVAGQKATRSGDGCAPLEQRLERT